MEKENRKYTGRLIQTKIIKIKIGFVSDRKYIGNNVKVQVQTRNLNSINQERTTLLSKIGSNFLSIYEYFHTYEVLFSKGGVLTYSSNILQ